MIDVLNKFDQFLKQKNLEFECIVIGGAALIHLGIITRRTQDVDLIDPEIPVDIKMASIEFAKQYLDLGLVPDEWFNSGPISLKDELLGNWKLRLVKMMEGESLTIWTLGREDLLKTKLFACCCREEDFDDCIALKPTANELNESLEWVQLRDANQMWPEHVNKTFLRIKKELGHE